MLPSASSPFPKKRPKVLDADILRFKKALDQGLVVQRGSVIDMTDSGVTKETVNDLGGVTASGNVPDASYAENIPDIDVSSEMEMLEKARQGVEIKKEVMVFSSEDSLEEDKMVVVINLTPKKAMLNFTIESSQFTYVHACFII